MEYWPPSLDPAFDGYWVAQLVGTSAIADGETREEAFANLLEAIVDLIGALFEWQAKDRAQGAEARPSGEPETHGGFKTLSGNPLTLRPTVDGFRDQMGYEWVLADDRTPASVVQPQEWQPIESAPTDRAIMMYDVAFGVYDIGRLWSPETMPQPTHWMPLPAAPTDRRVTEDGP